MYTLSIPGRLVVGIEPQSYPDCLGPLSCLLLGECVSDDDIPMVEEVFDLFSYKPVRSVSSK